MTEYICKCGRKLQRSTQSETTGNKLDGYAPGHECFGCPYVVPITRWENGHFVPDHYECVASKELRYETYASLFSFDRDSTAGHILSLDFDFLRRVAAECDKHEATISLNREKDGQMFHYKSKYRPDGRFDFTIYPTQNKAGANAKRAIFEKFFTDGGARKDLTPEQEKEKILNDIQEGLRSELPQPYIPGDVYIDPTDHSRMRVVDVTPDKKERTWQVQIDDGGGGWGPANSSFYPHLHDAVATLGAFVRSYGLIPDQESNDPPKSSPTSPAASNEPPEIVDESSAPEPAAGGSEPKENALAANPVISELSQPAAFDFGADVETNAGLFQDAQIFMAGSMARVMAAKHAHDLTASNYRGSWGKWCQVVGISRDTGDNMVRVAEQFGNIQVEGRDLIDLQPLKLLYAASKPSTPPEVRQKVETLDITSYKQYQEQLEQTLAQCQELKNQAAQEAKNAATEADAAEAAKNQAGQEKAAAEAAKAAAEAAKAAAETAQENAEANQATAEQQAALAGQERAKAEAAAKTAESWTPDGAVDAIWAARLDGTNTAEIFQQYAAALIAQGVDIDTIVRRWFTLLWDNNTYGTKLYKFATSATPDGELIQASADLGTAKPGTNTAAAVDPYFPRGAFWAVEVAYEIENKEPVVKAVAGVNGVDRETLLSGKFGMVGVAQKTGWVCDTADDNYYYHYYRAAPAYFLADANAYKPLPESVAVDGSLRPFVIHAKYMAGRGADGKLTSASGLAAVNFISMDGQRAEWKKRGADYCGICGCDLAFRMRMFWAKYGKKGNSGTLEGCSGYSYQYKAAVSETGVTRVIMTAAQADSYLVGSTVSVGDVGTGTSTDRGVASMRAKADKVRILSIEDVTVDGTAYKALNLDTATPFDTEKDKTIVSTMPWHSGSCDNVQGADGSPTSCTSGKEPFIIQLLECQPGGYAISADQLTEQVMDDTAYTHRLVFFRQAAQIATSITANAVRSPIVLTMPTTQTGQWMYEKDVEIDADGNMYPVDAGSGASSTNGCRAGVWVAAAGSRVWAWWAWAGLTGWGVCGLSGGVASRWAGYADWPGLCGACGSGANRGEYAGA